MLIDLEKEFSDGRLREYAAATAKQDEPSESELKHFHQLIASASKIDSRLVPDTAVASTENQLDIGNRLVKVSQKKQTEGKTLEQRLTNLLNKKR